MPRRKRIYVRQDKYTKKLSANIKLVCESTKSLKRMRKNVCRDAGVLCVRQNKYTAKIESKIFSLLVNRSNH